MVHRTPSPLLAGPWPPPRQVQAPSPSYSVDQSTIRQLLGFNDTDLRDILFINDKKSRIPEVQRAQAERIVSSTLFQQWIVSTSSSKLLVQWNSQATETIAGISALTVFCTAMVQALRSQNRFISALWSCGLHCDRNDAGDCVGARVMLASLVDQILRQHLFYTGNLHNEINLHILEGSQSLEELLNLLGWLIRQLPRTSTLFFIIDGVYLYEREEFWTDARDAFLGILRLMNDTSVSATVKIFFASAHGTTIVRSAFEAEGLILSVDELPKLGWAPSDERLVREMGIDDVNSKSPSAH
jgi:hypothetical protein